MAFLGDPSNDRQVKDMPPPPLKQLDTQLMFPQSNGYKPDWVLLRSHLQKEGRIHKEDLIKLVQMCNKILKNEGNLLHLADPLTIVGDIHGQFYDLLKILEVGGHPDKQKYVFLGDYVDRGSFSIETVILLYALKINYPSTIYLLRGNHECRQLTQFFNFLEECRYKYDQEIYEIIMDSFDNLPLACIVNNQFIALHGGISPELIQLTDLNSIDRFQEPPRSGIICDLIWSDPVENDNGVCEGPYRVNDVRGCSYFYGVEAVQAFLERNNLISVIRAHEAQLEGYKMHRWSGAQEFPMVITVFSAPNYCDVYNNKGAVIKFDNNALNIQQFNYSAHPYLLPDFMDVFSWSVPFVAEKITEILFHLIQPVEGETFSDDEVQEEDIQKFNQMVNPNQLIQAQEKEKRSDILKNKVKFVSKMMKMQRLLRMENEQIVQLKGVCPDKRIPKGLLSGSGKEISNALGVFHTARKADIINEKRPEKENIIPPM